MDEESQIRRELVERLTDQYMWRLSQAEVERAARRWIMTCFDRLSDDVLEDFGDVVDPVTGP